MTGRIASAAVLVLLVIIAGCNVTRVGSQADPAAAFGRYTTFAFNDPAVLSVIPQPVGPGVQQAILLSTTRELEGKGLRRVDDVTRADLVILFTIGDRSAVFADQQQYKPGFGWYADERGTVDYQTGQLAIDAYDARTRQIVWHGWATKSISGRDQASAPALIERTIRRVFNDFPR